MGARGLVVKDSFGLMTREAAESYMNTRWERPEACGHQMARYARPEAALGCTLFRQHVGATDSALRMLCACHVHVNRAHLLHHDI